MQTANIFMYLNIFVKQFPMIVQPKHVAVNKDIKQLYLTAEILFVFSFLACHVTLMSVCRQYSVGSDDCGERVE